MPRLLVSLLLIPGLLPAATTVLFDPSTPATGPFPTDFLTVQDPQQKTGQRLNLPLPSCASLYTSCQETGLLEQMDGYSIRARVTVRFSAAINTSTVRAGMFYVALNNLTQEEPGINKPGDLVTVDQVVFDPLTNTIYAKPFGALDQHRRYALVVTDAVLDNAGAAVTPDPVFQTCMQGGSTYCAALQSAVGGIAASLAPHKIVSATVFTTQSATAWLEHARATLPYVPPVVTLAQPQSTFAIANLSGIVLNEQVGANPAVFNSISLPISTALLAGLGSVVIGSYESPNFLGGDQSIAPAPTLPGLAVPASTNQVGFNALLPATPKPAAGYPVVIFGHGFGDSRFGGPTAVAPTLARAGFAVIAIDAVGHGFGPLSTVTFIDNAGNKTTINALGRGIDLNGDGIIESEEGCNLSTPITYGLSDCFRQTVVDLMQLVHAMQAGMDFDGDGMAGSDASCIYYGGESLGGMYGTMFMSLEPDVRAAALNVGGASTMDIAARWSAAGQSLVNQRVWPAHAVSAECGVHFQPGLRPARAACPQRDRAGSSRRGMQNGFETLEWLSNSGRIRSRWAAPHLQ